MKPTIIHLDRLALAGLSFYGDPFDTSGVWTEENQIGRLWSRFHKALDSYGDRLVSLIQWGVMYEVHVYGEETLEQGLFEVFVGAQVERPEEVPVELLVKRLPASDYAVFTLQGEQILSDWVLHIQGWLAEAGYQQSHSYSFLLYDERFIDMDHLPESMLDVYIPVVKAADPQL